MFDITYEIICPLVSPAALDRLVALLTHEGVSYEVNDWVITSISTPMVLLSIQPNQYTHKNWVGINPFIFVSGVKFNCKAVDAVSTRVTVSVNRRRAFIFLAFWSSCFFLATSALPVPVLSRVLLFAGLTCAAWLGVVVFFAGYLLKKEIGNELFFRTPIKSSLKSR